MTVADEGYSWWIDNVSTNFFHWFSNYGRGTDVFNCTRIDVSLSYELFSSLCLSLHHRPLSIITLSPSSPLLSIIYLSFSIIFFSLSLYHLLLFIISLCFISFSLTSLSLSFHHFFLCITFLPPVSPSLYLSFPSLYHLSHLLLITTKTNNPSLETTTSPASETNKTVILKPLVHWWKPLSFSSR